MIAPSMTRTATSTDRSVVLARNLLFGVIVSMLESTSLAVVLEVVASLATIACFAALLRPKAFAGDWLLGNRFVMMFATAILAFEIMFVLEARSGYVVLSIMMVVITVLLVRGTRRAKLLAGLGVLACA